MASMLALGGGAAEGLESVLARLMQEDHLRQQEEQIGISRSGQAEDVRHNKATEDITGRNAAAVLANTIANQKATQDEKLSDNIRATADTRGLGDVVTEEERTNEMRHGIPSSRYSTIPGLKSRSTIGVVSPEGKVESTTTETQGASHYRNAGTSSQRDSAERITAAEARAIAADKDRDNAREETDKYRDRTLELAADREGRLASYGAPIVVIADPNNPGATIALPRNQIPAGGAAGPQTSPQRSQEIMNEVGNDQLQNLKKLYKAEYVGPAAGRIKGFMQKVPGTKGDEGFAQFSAATATMRNAIIKAITGAQMSEPEAQRIREQIPEITDKPEVWQAKMVESEKNIQMLADKLASIRGAGRGAAGAGGDASDPLGLGIKKKP